MAQRGCGQTAVRFDGGCTSPRRRLRDTVNSRVLNKGFVARFCASLCRIAESRSGAVANSTGHAFKLFLRLGDQFGQTHRIQQADGNPARERLADLRQYRQAGPLGIACRGVRVVGQRVEKQVGQHLRNDADISRTFLRIRQGQNDHPFGAFDTKDSRPKSPPLNSSETIERRPHSFSHPMCSTTRLR
jgi:hypothetical protein